MREVEEGVSLVHGLPSDNDGGRRVDEGAVHVEQELKRAKGKGVKEG